MAVILAGLLGSGIGVFGLKSRALGNFPALLYIPLPFLLWAAVRLGPAGLSLSFRSIRVHGTIECTRWHGPFVSQLPDDNIFWLQIFLLVFFSRCFCWRLFLKNGGRKHRCWARRKIVLEISPTRPR